MNSSIFNLEKLRGIQAHTPFFVFSPQALHANVKQYQDQLPVRTEICYAMKSNSELPVLKILKATGISFELASKYELALLKKLKVPAQRIINGAPVQSVDHIRAFVKFGVDRFAFDCQSELEKLARHAPGSRVYVRVLVDDRSDSVFHMSEKFGAPLKNSVRLLLRAKKLGLMPYGISFNVGSQARNEHGWVRGIADVARAMKWLEDKDIRIQMVNIGGGFPYNYQDSKNIPSFKTISKHIREAAKKLPYSVNFIAEPGRGLVADVYALVISVIALNKRSNGTWLFVDAGVYNALLEAMAYQGSIRYRMVSLKKDTSSKKKRFIVTGPTCDNLDVIDKEASLPADVAVGDRLVIYDTGAYSFTLATVFNGFPKPKTVSI